MLSRKALVISDEDVLISQPTQGERLRVEFEKNKGIVSFVNMALVGQTRVSAVMLILAKLCRRTSTRLNGF